MKYLLLLYVVFWSLDVEAQIGPCSIYGVENSGDIYYSIDPIPDPYALGYAGSENVWSFTTLQSPRTLTYQYTLAKKARFYQYFEQAEAVLIAPSGKEIFFIIRGGTWYEVGYAVFDGESVNPKVVRYSVPIPACPPERMNQTATYQSVISPDSGETVLFKDRMDASGVLFLPDEVFDVYRTRRERTYITSRSERIKVSYIFTDQLTGEYLMEVITDADEIPEKIIYKSQKAISDTHFSSSRNQVLLYPNTSYGEIRLEFTNFEAGYYFFVIHDIVGKELWRKRYEIKDDITIKEDLSFLSRGTYTYTIIDSDYNRIVTKRLAIIKS